MGSGETAPTMVKVHRAVLERLGPPPVPAVLLDTPFGFQENAGELAARVVNYFRESLRAPIEVASTGSGALAGPGAPGEPGEPGALGGSGQVEGDDPFALERLVTTVRAARYVFAGPGSPSYALRKWRDTVVPSLLREKLQHGGGVTFSSAAALTLGVRTVPVYEVYKVGEDPRWLDGLDLLSEAGLDAAVIPHYNNAEGGTHDTRFCYLGERRLAYLERDLPEGAFVLGVDEHTALLLDLDDGSASIVGLGVVTVRAQGRSHTFAAGESLRISDLVETAGALAQGSAPGPEGAGSAVAGGRSTGADGTGTPEGDVGTPEGGAAAAGSATSVAHRGGASGAYADSPLVGLVRNQERAFTAALEQRDVTAAVAAVLEIENDVAQWSHDIPAGDALDRARASLRSLILELGKLGEAGAQDPRVRIGPFVEAMLELRATARAERRFDEADVIRDRLARLGVEVRDASGTTEWFSDGV